MIYDSLSHSNKYLINDFVCKNSYNTDSFLWNKNTTGILLRNTDSTFIDRNLFYKGYSGIQYYQINSSNHISNVERNKFVNCDYGFISATKTNPRQVLAAGSSRSQRKAWPTRKDTRLELNPPTVRLGRMLNDGSTCFRFFLRIP